MCFDKYGKTVLMMQTLIPSVIGGRDVTIDDIAEIHKDDLPVSNNCQEELFRWKRVFVTFEKVHRRMRKH